MMKTRNTFKNHIHYGICLRVLALLVCVTMALSLVGNLNLHLEADAASGGTYGSGALWSGTTNLTNTDLSQAMHIIIRHWHAEANPDAELVGDSNTVVIGAYIVPDGSGDIVDSNGAKYTLYARAYTANQEETVKWNRLNYAKVTKSTDSVYVKIKDNKVVFFSNPLHDGDVYHERFSGFSVSAGQIAVSSIYNGTEANHHADAELIIDPAYVPSTHLLKSHLFYASELGSVAGGTQVDGKDFPAYVDTAISSKGEKVYNSAEGLHTDKTATMHKTDESGEDEEGASGRTFDLDLEAWYNDGDPVDVGMVLDASGSMGFTANTPEPIRVIGPGNEDIYGIGSTALNRQLKAGSTGAIAESNFLTPTELAKIMNIRKTDNSSIRSGGFTYFIYDARTGTEEFVPLGYWDGLLTNVTFTNVESGSKETVKDVAVNLVNYGSETRQTVIGRVNNGAGLGWYYINPSGNWGTNYFAEGVESGKTLNGIPYQTTITDQRNGNAKTENSPLSFTDKLPADRPKAGAPEVNTNRTYTTATPRATTPTRFYIDAAGYLRCFYHVNATIYANGTAGWGTSFVYENNDQDYIKAEALQRALGAFITGLDAESPDSLVSAVRFSTPKLFTNSTKNSLDNLVLLDWTSDIQSAQQVLSGQRGTGKTVQGTSSAGSDFTKITGLSGIEQYNYGLTGSTSTKQGLNAFYGTYDNNNKYNLKYRLEQYNKKTGRNGTKYLIVFTDGKDTDLTDKNAANTGQDAVTTANKLKAAGYTIFCIMLTGGPIQEGTDDYKKTYEFLESISGVGTGNDPIKNGKYVYSTAEHEDEGTGSGSVDALVDIFTQANGILDMISNDLKDYSVQDYIDPRFDIVDAGSNVWHLNAGGEVVVKDADGKIVVAKYDLSKANAQKITLFNDISESNQKNLLTEKAQTAELRYDSVKNMYYLVWTNQTIPGSPVNSSSVKAWHGKVTVKAKDDFLGGNAVLSNGNNTNENYVYYPGDKNANSGINRSGLTAANHPSKGFPRTTVNVQPGATPKNGDFEVYEGQDITQEKVAKDLIEAVKKANEGTTGYYYWEYLERYMEYYNSHLDKDGNLTVDLPKPVDSAGNVITGSGPNGALLFGDLMSAISGDGTGLKLPYGYLPDDVFDPTNQTGQQDHELDILGYLTYSLKKQDGSPNYGVTEDLLERKTDFKIGYESIDGCTCDDSCTDCSNCTGCDYKQLNKRTAANSKLVKDKDYRWNRGYKDVVGEPLPDVQEFEGTHTTTIISGEIALQVELSKESIKALLDANITQISYSADLMRIDPNNSEKSKVGTFTIDIDLSDIDIDSIPDSYIMLQTASIDYDGSYDYVKGVTTIDKNGNEVIVDYGLPFGTYTLANGDTTYNGDYSPIIFGSPWVLPADSGEYGKDGVFELEIAGNTDAAKRESDYVASLDEENVEIELGEKDAKGDPNLSSRFGIFRVTASPAVGDLSISKTVKGGGDTNKEFTFIVELTPPEKYPTMDLAKSFEYDGSKKGTITFAKDETENKYVGAVKLKHGETITIHELPAFVTYEVTETDNEGYAVDVNNGEGEIEVDKTKAASFVNTPFSFAVTKRVLFNPLKSAPDGAKDEDLEFEFEMTLNTDEGPTTGVLTPSVLKYSTKHKKWIQQMIPGTVKVVTDETTGLVLSTERDADGNPLYATHAQGVNRYYLVPVSENISNQSPSDDVTQAVAIRAYLIPVDVVDSNATWNPSDYEQTYVTVYESDTTSGIGNTKNIQIDYRLVEREIYFDSTGKAEFTLKDGEGLLFSDIMPGTDYTVTEVLDENSGFSFGRVSDASGTRIKGIEPKDRKDRGDNVSAYTVEGTIPNNRNVEVHYFNLVKDFTLPLSGGNPMSLFILFGGLLTMLFGAAIVILSLKKERVSKREG